MNLSETFLDYLKSKITKRVIINEIENKDIDVCKKEMKNETESFTETHKKKIEFIKEVRKEYRKNRNYCKTAKLFKINRRTVKKYVKMKDIKSESKYVRET